MFFVCSFVAFGWFDCFCAMCIHVCLLICVGCLHVVVGLCFMCWGLCLVLFWLVMLFVVLLVLLFVDDWCSLGHDCVHVRNAVFVNVVVCASLGCCVCVPVVVCICVLCCFMFGGEVCVCVAVVCFGRRFNRFCSRVAVGVSRVVVLFVSMCWCVAVCFVCLFCV